MYARMSGLYCECSRCLWLILPQSTLPSFQWEGEKIDEWKRLRFLPCKNERERGLSISMHFPFTREQISPLEKREKIATRHARTFFSAKVMIMFGVSLFPYRMIGELSRCHHVSDQSWLPHLISKVHTVIDMETEPKFWSPTCIRTVWKWPTSN